MAELEHDKIIIGIDPGTNVMGYGILGIKGKTPSLIAMGVLKLNAMEDHYMRLLPPHFRACDKSYRAISAR